MASASTKVSRQRLKPGDELYVSKDELHRELEVSHRHKQITPALVKLFTIMVERYALKTNWNQYTYLEDMKQNAIVHLCTHSWMVYGPDKIRKVPSNPHAYFTTAIHNAFLGILIHEKKQASIIHRERVWAGYDLEDEPDEDLSH